MYKNEKGFGAVGWVILVVGVCVLGFIGWYVYNTTQLKQRDIDARDSAFMSFNPAIEKLPNLDGQIFWSRDYKDYRDPTRGFFGGPGTAERHIIKLSISDKTATELIEKTNADFLKNGWVHRPADPDDANSVGVYFSYPCKTEGCTSQTAMFYVITNYMTDNVVSASANELILQTKFNQKSDEGLVPKLIKHFENNSTIIYGYTFDAYSYY